MPRVEGSIMILIAALWGDIHPKSGGIMSSIFSVSLVFVMSSLIFINGALADTCDDPARQPLVCREMRHLRSQLLVLGAQRDTMQINFELLGLVGAEIKAGTNRALGHLGSGDPSHSVGLIGVQAIANDLIEQSSKADGEALLTANRIQQQCSTCHTPTAPTSGYRWDEIFKSDWSAFYNKCNSVDRNPYRCKSMHAMFSYYSGFFTAYQLGIKNYELTEKLAQQIARVAKDLKNNHLIHGLENLLSGVETDALEVAQLAADKNPEAFDRSMAITQTCMKCHADRIIVFRPAASSLSPWVSSKR